MSFVSKIYITFLQTLLNDFPINSFYIYKESPRTQQNTSDNSISKNYSQYTTKHFAALISNNAISTKKFLCTVYCELQLLAGAALVSAAPTEVSDAEAYAQLDQILKVHLSVADPDPTRSDWP
jgi:hypothetical protein